jgi:excisionase family DNA binding protein
MNTPDSTKVVLTAEGFADIPAAVDFLSVSRATVYKLMDIGELPYAKFGKSRRIPWAALREYASRCLVGTRE